MAININISLHMAIEHLAETKPNALKDKNLTYFYMKDLLWRHIKKYKIPKEEWNKPLKYIQVLVEEYCCEM